ncbi:MADS box transcription factor [Handroanthus impetiginosus]|uniref:MADS box transcription factor n=1 Tax=Handroanthus impetiginosus TaxID=429701 RepID=A0A2G9GS11_9LAMI|nr:MADS box transcription factor [Handroanthus impetiginosus]
MGRAKLKLELISKEKSRILTFKKRKQGLFTKLHQLTTLCDVNACMIIYGPKQEHGAVEPEIWPQNREEVRRIIGLYEAKNRGKGSSFGNNRTSTFGLSDFFRERKRKIEDETVRLRRKNMKAKYPTPVDLLNFSTAEELREFGALLKNKAEIIKSRIEFLKGNRGGIMNEDQSHDSDNVFCESTAAMGVFQNPMAVATMGNTGVFQNPVAVEQYYVPPVLVQPLPPLYMHCAGGMGVVAQPQLYTQCLGMGGVAPPQMQFPAMENYENGDDGLEDIIFQRAPWTGVVAPPQLYMQCFGMGGVAPPQRPFRAMENYENDGGGLEDITLQRTAEMGGMGGIARRLYSQCTEMDRVAPAFYSQCPGMDGVAPPQMHFPSMEINYMV